MYQSPSLANPAPAKSPRHDTRVRHHWGLHASEADDKKLAQFQEYAFQIGILKSNTKHALVRYALARLLETIAKLQEREDFQALVARAPPVPAPAPQPADPVVTALQAQKQIIETRLRALGVSQ